MLKRWGVLALAGVAAALLTAAPAAAQDKIKVLIIDGQNNHSWQQTTPFMKKALEDTGRFAVDVATTPAKPAEPKKPKDKDDQKAKAEYEAALARYQADIFPAYRAKMEAVRPDLGKYQVVLSNYNGDQWGNAFKKDFEEALRTGKVHLVIVHAANNSFGGWNEYDRM